MNYRYSPIKRFGGRYHDCFYRKWTAKRPFQIAMAMWERLLRSLCADTIQFSATFTTEQSEIDSVTTR